MPEYQPGLRIGLRFQGVTIIGHSLGAIVWPLPDHFAVGGDLWPVHEAERDVALNGGSVLQKTNVGYHRQVDGFAFAIETIEHSVTGEELTADREVGLLRRRNVKTKLCDDDADARCNPAVIDVAELGEPLCGRRSVKSAAMMFCLDG